MNEELLKEIVRLGFQLKPRPVETSVFPMQTYWVPKLVELCDFVKTSTGEPGFSHVSLATAGKWEAEDTDGRLGVGQSPEEAVMRLIVERGIQRKITV